MAAAAKAWSPRLKCCQSPHFSMASTRRRFRASARSGPARRLSRFAASRTRKSGFINAESEFAALSVATGASAAGARAYTATASQGLLFMAEAVYSAAGLGLPIVMTLRNRAIGAPINIWNDHSDAMALRESGWIQLFAEMNQEAADLHITAFRLAEALSRQAIEQFSAVANLRPDAGGEAAVKRCRAGWIAVNRVWQRRGEQTSLSDIQIARIFVEIAARRGLDSVNPVAPFGDVEINLERAGF
jgi:Pyruvate flavodoxin/ferredoxin oxidoreductase, thiamine diP-bdg